MDVWEEWLVGIAAVLTAIGVVWRKFLKPVIRGVGILTDAAPVLLKIAQEELRPNSGGSMHDKLTRLDSSLAERRAILDGMVEDLREHITDDKAIQTELRTGQERIFGALIDKGLQA